MHKKKVLDSRKFSTSGFRWIYMFRDVLNTIWPYSENVCLSICMVSKILWTLYLKNLCAETDETLYSGAPWYKLKLIRFWCISLKKFRYCSIFFISLTQWCRTKLLAIISNTNYFKPIILKFKTLNYYSKTNK